MDENAVRIIIAALAFAVGWLSHRQALKRERRKEWNEVVAPLRQRVIEAGHNALWRPIEFDDVELDAARGRMTPAERTRFDAALAAVQSAARTEKWPPAGVIGLPHQVVQDEHSFKRDIALLLTTIEIRR